jgi:hypothetical protein
MPTHGPSGAAELENNQDQSSGMGQIVAGPERPRRLKNNQRISNG